MTFEQENFLKSIGGHIRLRQVMAQYGEDSEEASDARSELNTYWYQLSKADFDRVLRFSQYCNSIEPNGYYGHNSVVGDTQPYLALQKMAMTDSWDLEVVNQYFKRIELILERKK